MTPVTNSSTIEVSFYVYGLYRDVEMTDPFYIGKGYGRRLDAHEKPSEIAKRHNVRKNRTIEKLICEMGFVPKRIVQDGLSEAAALALEIRLIAEYGRLDKGTGCLTNLSEGGLGARHSEETKAKIKEARARQVISAETREKIRISCHWQKAYSRIAGQNECFSTDAVLPFYTRSPHSPACGRHWTQAFARRTGEVVGFKEGEEAFQRPRRKYCTEPSGQKAIRPSPREHGCRQIASQDCQGSLP